MCAFAVACEHVLHLPMVQLLDGTEILLQNLARRVLHLSKLYQLKEGKCQSTLFLRLSLMIGIGEGNRPTCSLVIETGSVKIVHVTHSEQGGVVRLPWYRMKEFVFDGSLSFKCSLSIRAVDSAISHELEIQGSSSLGSTIWPSTLASSWNAFPSLLNRRKTPSTANLLGFSTP